MLSVTSKMCVEADLLDVGETVRLDHSECPAGEDTRRRLYLTRPHNAPDIVLCYCHNCQDSAVIKGKQQTWRGTWSDTKPPTGQEFEEPKSLNTDVCNWPPAARAWFMQYSILNNVPEKYGVAYAATYDRLYLPIYECFDMAPGDSSIHKKGDYLGYQLRSLDKLNSPKYLTAIVDDGQSYYTRFYDSRVGFPDYIIIVEDLMSAFKIWQARQGNPDMGSFEVLVNYGVKLNLDALQSNRNAAKGYIVWLDNDSISVQERAKEMARTWQLITHQPAWVVTEYQDPKSYTSAAIQQILEKTLSGHD